MSKPVAVRANTFEINKIPAIPFLLYIVAFNPPLLEGRDFRRRQELIHRLQNNIRPDLFTRRGLYDGDKLFFIPADLQLAGDGEEVFTVPLGKTEYQIQLKKTNMNAANPSALRKLIAPQNDPSAYANDSEAAMSANLLQLLIKQAPHQSFVLKKKAYFTEQSAKNLGKGIDLWFGFFQSVRPTIGRLLVNIDTTVAPVYQAGPLIDLVRNFLGPKARQVGDLAMRPNHPEYMRLRSFLKHLRVVIDVKTNKRRGSKAIHDLEPAAGLFKFDKDGQQMTVEAYYRQTYNITIRNPHIIGVVLSLANAPRTIVVPLELCIVIPGQFYKKRLDPDLTREMVKLSTSRPHDRLQKITRDPDGPLRQYQNSEYLTQSGMQVVSEPSIVKGRIIAPPSLAYEGGPLRVDNGKWNVLNQRLSKPAQLKTWTLVNFVPHSVNTEGVLRMFQATCNGLGIEVGAPQYGDGNMQAPIKSIIDVAKRGPGQIIVVILPRDAEGLRRTIKYWGDCDQGVRTQCLRENKVNSAVQKKDTQYFNNVLLKMNARLGGLNQIVTSSELKQLTNKAVMVVGADSSHPGPSSTKPSVASLVWSYDQHLSQYIAFTRMQPPRVEMIQELGAMMEEALKLFRGKNKVAPSRILFFRDGLSEGEFAGVGEKEIADIEAAMQRFYFQNNLGPVPQLTYVVVGKRHHVVFFPDPALSREAADLKTGNCVAGFATDAGQIANPVYTDFYLQSHSAIQGTSRSSHYIVLRDDIFGKRTAPLQEVAYGLCHVYAKATRSVSIPAPVYYADLACGRGNFHVDPRVADFDDGSSDTSGQAFNAEKWRSLFKEVHSGESISKSMYFL